MRGDLDKLQPVFEMIKEIELSRAAVLQSAVDDLRAEWDVLHQRQTRGGAPDSGSFPALQNWNRWIDQEKRRLALEMARARAAQEDHRVALRKAFGRAEAVKKLTAPPAK